MTSGLDVKLEAVDDMLARLMPMLNDISQSSFFIQQGDLQYSKHRAVEAELTKWTQQNAGVLPDPVVASVASLNHRIVEWVMSGGTTATVSDFARDGKASFAHGSGTLNDYKVSLIE